MEYKFKTIHEGKLVDCYVVKHMIFLKVNLLRVNLLRMRETRKISCGYVRVPLEDAPVFQYIGKKDRDGEDIYCGHQLIMPDEKLEENQEPKKYKVVFEEMVSGFVLENEWNQIFHCDDRMRLMKIVGHSAIENQEPVELRPVSKDNLFRSREK